MILKQRYCPSRWLKILEICIEKGKGPLLGKLQNLQLIEGDLQIMMRMFLFADGKELIEKDPRFSKANYRLRLNYSIKTALLEKRIIFDNSMLTMENTICTFTDLKVCYDRQLVNLGGIIEESVGRDQNIMIMFAKILLA